MPKLIPPSIRSRAVALYALGMPAAEVGGALGVSDDVVLASVRAAALGDLPLDGQQDSDEEAAALVFTSEHGVEVAFHPWEPGDEHEGTGGGEWPAAPSAGVGSRPPGWLAAEVEHLVGGRDFERTRWEQPGPDGVWSRGPRGRLDVLDQAVLVLRDADFSWSVLAEALGMSRSGVRYRFRRATGEWRPHWR